MRKTTLSTIFPFFLVCILLLPIYLNLGKENVNFDQLLWYPRTILFTQGLNTGNFSLTYQQYHPGVTLMYLIMFGQKLYGLVTHGSVIATEVPYTLFPLYNLYTKLFVTTFCVSLNLLSALLLSKVTKSKTLYLGFLFFLFTEPFYVGLLRNLHMDAIAASLIFTSVTAFYAGALNKKTRYFILSGVFAGLGLLTKSITVTALFFNIAVGAYFIFRDKNFWILKRLLLMLFSSALVFICLFPAMWVSPLQTLDNIFVKGVVNVGLRGEDSFGHYVNGVETSDPGLSFYPLVLKYRLASISQLLVLLFIVINLISVLNKARNTKVQTDFGRHEPLFIFMLFSFIYVLTYIVLFSFLSKKTDRYIAPVMPFVALIIAYTFDFIYKARSTKRVTKYLFSLLVVLVFLNLLTLIKIHPYYFAYYNPMWGGLKQAKWEIYVNQGGIGALEVANYLNSIKITDQDKIGATNYLELGVFSKYPVTGLRPELRKEYKYVIVPLQRDGALKENMNQIYTLKILGDTYWRIYSR